MHQSGQKPEPGSLPRRPTDPHHHLDARIAAAEAEAGALANELDQLRRLSTLGMLLAIVAHEFNNLLTPVLSYAQLARSNPDDRDLTLKALDRAAAGAGQASQIAAAVLSLARPAAAAAPALCHVERVVDETLRCLGRDLSRDGITLVRDIEPGLQAAIAGPALQQVLLNLILNARRAMQKSGGELRIAARRSSPGPAASGLVVITLSDSGPGMSAEVASRLFTPFVTTAGDDGGTGLGLVLCKRLVEAAGGAIRVHSAVGEGTRFEIEVREGARP